jgi:SAM-dependent methyltransferase
MKDRTHYNVRVNSATAERLLDLNRRFYVERGHDFSETRLRLQPGVRRVLKTLRGDESVLDLGCGNGALARELSRRGHRGRYTGLDFSIPLLEIAEAEVYSFPARFARVELPLWDTADLVAGNHDGWSLIVAFAVLHHIPGRERRLALLSRVRRQLSRDGSFIHSNWQFTANPRFQQRIQPWTSAGLDALQVDADDHLLDWRRGGNALRYVHEFNEAELADLASRSGFAVAETFYSDGADHRSGLYQTWRPA